MKKFYVCSYTIRNPYIPSYSHLHKTSTAEIASKYLYLYSLWGGRSNQIPIILVEEDDTILEFFTRTKFEREGDGFWKCLKLPQSTLVYNGRSSAAASYKEIMPTEALKILEPWMDKKFDKCGTAIQQYFNCFRDKYKSEQEEKMNAEKENMNAEEALSRYWGKK